ncbi:MAG: hypoxanthine-guanine phosphoribosyltransferase [Pseudomonadota bacterium]
MDKSTLPGPVSIIHSPAAVDAAVRDIAARINADLAAMAPAEPPLVICVLTGAIVFTGMLLPHLDFPLELDYLHATRYGSATVGGELRWIARPCNSLKGRVVILVDDILDEGVTLHQIQAHCRAEGASRVLTAVLINKVRPRSLTVPVDYLGLNVPDVYVFGYGMDCSGLWRNAPGVFALHEGISAEVNT